MNTTDPFDPRDPRDLRRDDERSGAPVRPDVLADGLPVEPLATGMPPVMQTPPFEPPRRRWPGMVALAAIAGVLGIAVVSGYYGTGRDATRPETAATQAGERAATSIDDAGITAAVKTALAADPSLSALQIDVTTREGVVTLEGPAPDMAARERAGMLASQSDGVRSVDNQLVVSTA